MKNTFLLLFMLAIFASGTMKAEESSYPYHSGDSLKIVTFLNLPSTELNVINGKQLNPSYSPTDPTT
jgi:hypothetical protein